MTIIANGTSISDLKEKVVDALLFDETIVYAIDAKECENSGDLIGTHIFKYHKNPDTLKNVGTFITVIVHTRRSRNKSFIIPTLIFHIYSHDSHMKMDTMITKDNRNDYIAMLLEEKFNGSDGYGGIGKLCLIENTEESYNKDYLYRRLIFDTIDLNESLC